MKLRQLGKSFSFHKLRCVFKTEFRTLALIYRVFFFKKKKTIFFAGEVKRDLH